MTTHQLSETELEQTRELLRADRQSGHDDLKLALVRLAHDGSDAAMEILKKARPSIPASLRGFYECAWDECCYFNFISKVEEVALAPEALPELLEAGKGKDGELEVECQELEERLAERGVLVDLVPDVPIVVRHTYVQRLLQSLGDLRYHGSGFVHFDGCTGSCDWCVQKEWCEIASADEPNSARRRQTQDCEGYDPERCAVCEIKTKEEPRRK